MVKGPRLREDGAKRRKTPDQTRHMVEINSFLALKVAEDESEATIDEPSWSMPLGDNEDNWALLGKIITRLHELGGSRLAEVTAARELAPQFFTNG